MSDDFMPDPIDDRLRSAFRNVDTTETDTVLAELRPRMERARRRRRVTVAGTSALGIAAAIALGVLVFSGQTGTARIKTPPAASSVPGNTKDSDTATTSTAPDGRADDNGSSSDDGEPGVGDNSGSGSSDDPTGSSPPASTPVASPGEQTFDSVGGSARIKFQDGQLSVVSTSPNSGYVVEIEAGGPTEIEIRFESDSHESRIKVQVEDGQMRVRVEEEDD